MPTISVGCRMANGLRLHLDDPRETHEQILGGGTRLVKRYFRRPGSDVVLKGWSRYLAMVA